MDGNNITTGSTVVTKQSRLRSWALWVSVAALAVWCVKTFAGRDVVSVHQTTSQSSASISV